MEEKVNTIEAQHVSSAIIQPTVGVVSVKYDNQIESLTRKQQDRLYSILTIYGTDSYTIIDFFKKKQSSSWTAFLERSKKINHPLSESIEYDKRVTEAFEPGTCYSKHQIVMTICACRTISGLPSFPNDLQRECMNEFARLFLHNELKEPHPSGKGIIRLYQPVIALLGSRLSVTTIPNRN